MMEIKVNKTEDVELYYKYLFDNIYVEKYPFIRKKLLNLFPQLWDITIGNRMYEEVAQFVESLYVKYHLEINHLLRELIKKFNNYEKSLIKAFLESMDCDYEQIKNHSIVLSLFPFSTFWSKEARLCILDSLGEKKREVPYMDIFIHEFSHIVVKKYFTEYGLIHDQLLFDVIKELMAPILMKSHYFQFLPINEKSKLANPEYEYLYIWNSKLIDCVEHKYTIFSKSKKFSEIILLLYDFLYQYREDLIEKKMLFNKLYSGWNMRDSEFIKKLEDSKYFVPLLKDT